MYLFQLRCPLIQTELEISYGLVSLLQHSQLLLGETVVPNAAHPNRVPLLYQTLHPLVAILQSFNLRDIWIVGVVKCGIMK